MGGVPSLDSLDDYYAAELQPRYNNLTLIIW